MISALPTVQFKLAGQLTPHDQLYVQTQARSCIAPPVELRGDVLVPALQVPTALITMRESRLGVVERNFGSADLSGLTDSRCQGEGIRETWSR
jgi:hypothetical protein